MALNYVNLTLDLFDGQGNELKTGNVIFTPSVQLTDTVEHELITRAQLQVSLVGGSPVVKLLATDNGNLNPSGWSWDVTFQNVPGNPPEFSFHLVFASGANQFLSSQTPL